MTYTAQSCREEAAINDKFGDPIMNDPDLLRAHADALEEKARLRADNDTLRGLLGNSALPCPYCGLAAEDQSKCAHGFPGCARADDQMLSKHFADGYRAERAEAELAKLRQHAEAMERYKAFVDWMSLYGATISVVADERGSLRLDWYRGTAFGGSMDELMQALDDKISAYRADFPEEK